MKNKKIPKKLQAVLWSVDIDKLDLNRNKAYIVHQILAYGTLEQIKWLFKNYKKEEIIDVFLNNPTRSYSRDMYLFIKNYLLDLNNKQLDENDYITSFHGPVRQRAAKSFS